MKDVQRFINVNFQHKMIIMDLNGLASVPFKLLRYGIEGVSICTWSSVIDNCYGNDKH